MYSDLFARLDACDWLDRKIIHFELVDDVGLGALYDHAWLTVFPSLVEGWGLPVAESLVRQKACLASSSSSIPEVGGDVVQYFSPYDPLELKDIMLRLVAHPEEVQAMEVRIRGGHKPSGWDHCARSVMTILVEGLEQMKDTTT